MDTLFYSGQTKKSKGTALGFPNEVTAQYIAFAARVLAAN
jgi:hypothetical protein